MEELVSICVPAEHATTPFHLSALLRCAILLYAPRSLKLKTGCKSSLLSKTLQPNLLLRFVAYVSGVSVTTSYTRDVRMSRRYYDPFLAKMTIRSSKDTHIRISIGQ